MAHPLPVLIVGSGLSGLVTAITLLQNKVPVRVITKKEPGGIYHRGSATVPRTIEAHRFIGTYDRFKQVARPFPQAALYQTPGKGEIVKEFYMRDREEDRPDIPDANWHMCPQYQHEGLLLDFLRDTFNFEVDYQQELDSFEEHDGAVLVSIRDFQSGEIYTSRYSYLVGADGARSTVRKQLKELTFLGEIRGDFYFIITDFYIKKGLDIERGLHFWGNMSKKMICMFTSTPSIGHYFTFMTGEWDKDYLTGGRENFIEAFQSFTGRTDVEFGNIINPPSIYHPNMRMVNRFNVGRAFVVGDAAHVQSPTGGQGLNSGFLDAVNLGWKLSLVWKGLASHSLLDSFTEERLPVIKEMLLLTTRLLEQASMPSQGTPEAIKRRGDTDQLGVNYRSSRIILDEINGHDAEDPGSALEFSEPGKPRAGERAPNASGFTQPNGEPTRTILFDLFSVAHHQVLLFASFNSGQSLARQVVDELRKLPPGLAKTVWLLPGGSRPETSEGEMMDVVLVDAEGLAYKGYGVDYAEQRIVIIRPDGVVGALLDGSAVGIEVYFKKFLA